MLVHGQQGLESKQNVLLAYVFYSSLKDMFEYFGSGEQRYVLQSQRTCYAVADRIATLWDAGNRKPVLKAVERSDPVDEAQRYLAASIFSAQHYLVRTAKFSSIKMKSLKLGPR